MLNVAIRNLLILSASAVVVTSCGESADTKAARALLEQAKTCLDEGNFTRSLELLDSIESAYPAEIAQRREGLHLRPKAIEGVTLRQLETTDSLIAALQIENERLSSAIRFVENPVEGYYVSTSAVKGDFIGTNGIQPRITPEGIFYIVSSVGRPVKSTAVTLTSGGESATTATVAHDDERNYRRNGVEVITFMASECDTLGRFALTHRDQPMKLTFDGATPYTIDFQAARVEELASVYEAATAVNRGKKAQLDKTRLERQLALSRSQQARTFQDEAQGEE